MLIGGRNIPTVSKALGSSVSHSVAVCLHQQISDKGNVSACVYRTLSIHHGPKFKTVTDGNFRTAYCDKNCVLISIMIAIVAINFLWLIFKLGINYTSTATIIHLHIIYT